MIMEMAALLIVVIIHTGGAQASPAVSVEPFPTMQACRAAADFIESTNSDSAWSQTGRIAYRATCVALR